MDARDENEARAQGGAALYDLYADVRERLGREVPVKVRTVRPATADEIDLWGWHQQALIASQQADKGV